MSTPGDTPDSGDPKARAELDQEYGIDRHVEEPALHEPVLIVMLTGWIDAAGAAAAAMDQLSRACESTPILSFDDDRYVDYRARRPTMELRDGLNTNLDWATIEMRSGRSPDGQDVLFLVGPEPDMAWRRFSRAVAMLAVEFGVTQMVSLGAYPFAAPHTRPARLSVSSPSIEMLAAVSFARSSVDVPAGMAGVLEHAMHAQKIPALGIWAQVPHYVSAMEYPAASVALLDGLERGHRDLDRGVGTARRGRCTAGATRSDDRRQTRERGDAPPTRGVARPRTDRGHGRRRRRGTRVALG